MEIMSLNSALGEIHLLSPSHPSETRGLTTQQQISRHYPELKRLWFSRRDRHTDTDPIMHSFIHPFI